ncbi:DUF726-domain-containing protein [Guyanagaster necrorhizus]|uniref:DUF726-domain-containing protein n=1 Tax=Guyanagaster necrorhizus TaxID=856835 RepID=A0A9P7W3I1_9AGAR|nr:DUF726-domain-containing protein [Guyanagaster necrorhizus MCA 3950]KAG7451899.1 DUF726-domain-containing protein [Guyanagaster necrorhizus MCA 3950]
MPVTTAPAPVNVFDDDDEGWQDMPVIREDELKGGLDEEDQKRYHYVPSVKGTNAANAIGNIDVDDLGNEWRSKIDHNESEYTRLRVREEDDNDDVHLRTRYLFDEDKAMTPLSQMQATKNLLTEAQRIAYVGLCSLTSREMAQAMKVVRRKELKAAVANMELWAMKIMGRLYYHMELETQEQKMIESLGEHGVLPMDLVPALMTTHTVANPEYDPDAARRRASHEEEPEDHPDTHDDPPLTPSASTKPTFQTTAKVLEDTSTIAIPGVSTTLSSADERVTLDIRWTVLCDLFLILIADSVYDARSRVLLENVALKLGLGWLDVVKFESRVTEALEIQEDVERMENEDIIDSRRKANRKKRYMMLGLATLGGGLVIGLSAGLLAPVIGVGLGAAFSTIGITGTTGFLAGAGGAAVITTGGVLTGSGIAVRGMINRTQQVRTFDLLPLHNNKRVNCIITVPGFLNGALDDPRLPFSVLDPIVGDVFSVLWEPEMIRETGSALKILTGEVLSQIGATVLQATVMTALMSALQWPIILTKLGYLIDNPWNNALDRAKAAGSVLADVLMQRHLGVRPMTLIGYSLGARVIFYALVELVKQKAFGIVQDVFILGTTVTASSKTWCETRSVVSGRYVNAFARNDWVLNYLFRATSGGVGTVAGLRPVDGVPGLENVDVTDKISGHMSYRTFMPLILDQLGFPVSADYFDEPEEPEFTEDRVVVREEDTSKKKGWFSRKSKTSKLQHVSRPPGGPSSYSRKPSGPASMPAGSVDNDLPPRIDSSTPVASPPSTPQRDTASPGPDIPIHAGFDFAAIKEMIESSEHPEQAVSSAPIAAPPIPPPTNRTESMPQAKRWPSLTPGPSTSRSPSPPQKDEMSSVFSRSMSFNDANDSDVEDEPSRSPHASLPFSPPSYSQSPPPSSFGVNDSWSGPPSRTTTLSSFNNYSYTLPTYSTSAASLSQNPFASSLATPPDAGALSFGDVDGSITTASPADVGDPWSIPTHVGRRKNTGGTDYSSNPWS